MIIIRKIILHAIIFFFLILRLPGCYSILPSSEIDNGDPTDARTWKYYQIRWKAGSNPELEAALHRYYGKCNPGCIKEYALDIDLLERDDLGMGCNRNEDIEVLLERAQSIFLTEVDTCGASQCVGTYISWSALDGELKQLIKNADGVKNRKPVSSDETKDPRTWKYFKILCRTNKDSLFTRIQEDLGITPLLDSYTLVINITDSHPQNQYVVLGDELDPSAQRFAWSQLSKRVRNSLISWDKPNKTR